MRRSGLSPAALSSAAALSGPTPGSSGSAGMWLRRHQRCVASGLDLGGQLEDAVCQQLQGVGGSAGGVAGRGAFELRASLDQNRCAEAGEGVAQRRVGADEHGLSWLTACVRDLIAELLASLNIRSISTGPSLIFAVAVARPEKHCLGGGFSVDDVVLARLRRAALSGWLTSMTSMSFARK